MSGRLIYVMVVFSPWAFGTTEPWSIWTMNCLGYALGALLCVKLAIRGLTGYRNPRWDAPASAEAGRLSATARLSRLLTQALTALTVFLLLYCLVSIANARSTYLRAEAIFLYHPFVAWLPHSFDRIGTWQAFRNYLALAGFFWGARDWLLGKSPAEQRAERSKLSDPAEVRAMPLPQRLRSLLWVLTINGGLLGLEAIIQRVDGQGKLLFLVRPRIHKTAEGQFGPYAYRSNAAQYFNLAWPVSLGLWWSLQRAARKRASQAYKLAWANRHVLLICVVVMAACPIISTTRAGALVALANLSISAAILWWAQPKGDVQARVGILLCLGLVLGLAAWLGWAKLAPRLEADEMQEGFAIRNEMYSTARQMVVDYPWLGTGPGTFEPLFQLYRIDPNEYWPAQLHDDWLETRITFGWVGSGLIMLALALVIIRPFVRGGIHGGQRLVALTWLALAGCLVHARYDFPMQVYSVLSLFLLLCAILFSVSRRPLR